MARSAGIPADCGEVKVTFYSYPEETRHSSQVFLYLQSNISSRLRFRDLAAEEFSESVGQIDTFAA